MAFFFFSSKNRVINLVVNDHSVRFLELKQENPPAAQRWSERFLPPGIITNGKITDIVSLTSIMEECIHDLKIHRRQVRFIVPDPLVIIRKVSVPAEIQEDEMKGYLYLELGVSIHLPFEEPVFDYYLLNNNGKTKELLLFAAPEPAVMEYIELLSSLKLHPIAAEISPLALYRLYHQLDQKSMQEILFSVQLDLTSANLTVFEEDVPLVMRHISLPFTIEQWDIKTGSTGAVEYRYTGESIEMKLLFEDVIREINKLIDYYRYTLKHEKQEITKFLLNGDHPMLETIYNELVERYEVPVAFLSLDQGIKGTSESLPASFYLNLGLALKGVQ